MPLGNKERFVKAEGVELMIIIMKQKKSAYSSAIRTLDFAMTRFPPACERFVDVLGLKTAFAAFMGKIPVNKKNKNESYQEELEERIISLVASLFGKQASLFQCPLYTAVLDCMYMNLQQRIDKYTYISTNELMNHQLSTEFSVKLFPY
ncbi:hypothetical protein ACQJBY_066939 [Aegilops geniculata]